MKTSKHILLFEPRIQGHHLNWLGMLAEDFIEAGYQITLATDLRNNIALKVLYDLYQSLPKNLNFLPVFNEKGDFIKKNAIQTLAFCLNQSSADEAFCISLDEFASSIARKAAFGFYPPKSLINKISGVFHRPRPIDFSLKKTLGLLIKRFGFHQLLKSRYIKHLFILDENLAAKTSLNNVYPLVEPSIGLFPYQVKEASRRLKLPDNKCVLFHYGTASKRKGLHILLDAFRSIDDDRLFLLVAGDVSRDVSQLNYLQLLEKQGRAKLLNYFVSDEEEKLCFAAADWIMLPYASHYGSSGILAKAVAAKKPVVASDYHLLGERVESHHLGYTFQNENAASLAQVFRKILNSEKNNAKNFISSLNQYALMTSRDVFRDQLYSVYPKV